MPEMSLDRFSNEAGPPGRLLGLDLGEKTIGLAISDAKQGTATPLLTIKRAKFTQDAQALKQIIQERAITGLVVGLPLNMDGSEGPRCQSTRQFMRNLEELADFSLPYLFWDERLTTQAAEDALIAERGMTREKRKAVIDQVAAQFILQGALDGLAQPHM